MIRWLYNLFFPLVFIGLLPAYLRRMVRRGNFRRNFGQRLGYFSPEVKARLAAGPRKVWVQAVSVGEMLVAVKLIDALRAQSPDLSLVISTTTTTGYQLATERVGAVAEVIYTPIDLIGAVRRTFEVLRPSQVVIVDGGLWPNQLWEARRWGIPVALVNARLSPRSERRFRRFRTVATSMFRLLDLVGVPEADNIESWESLGVPAGRVRHTGSIKFDDAADAPARAKGAPLEQVFRQVCPDIDAPVLLAGSTHPGEERIVAEAFLKLRGKFDRLFLIIAPRHVERTPEIRAELEALGLRVAMRTDTNACQEADLLLLNTTGELRDWYPFANVVFIGKSLTGTGGQNPAEAIIAGRPVIFGPHMENFADLASQLRLANAAVQIFDESELEGAVARLLTDADERTRLADAAGRQIATHRGAADRTAALLLRVAAKTA